MFQSHVPGSFPVCVRKIKKKKKINSRERLVNQPRDFPSISSTSSISTAHGPGVRLHLINQSINIFASLRHSRIAEYNQGMKKKKKKKKKKKGKHPSPPFPWGVVFLGICLRLELYAVNKLRVVVTRAEIF
ncbi:hypothetical protein I7I50_02711 [Histoplasma capsulatum G186AR]|nr:hypothetical protein I7I50_02711 [Histoplasma capsulatum G186AR]